MQKKVEKLQWKTKHTSDFSKVSNFLESVLIDNGVKEEDIANFLRPLKKHTHDPFKMVNMDKAVALAVEEIKKNSKAVKGGDDVKHVATVSANNDSELGGILAGAFEKVGKDGVITVEESKTMETTTEA